MGFALALPCACNFAKSGTTYVYLYSGGVKSSGEQEASAKVTAIIEGKDGCIITLYTLGYSATDYIHIQFPA
jgi:hypothetical protein